MPLKKSLQANANIKLALVLEKEKNYAGAIKLLNKATLQDPANPQAWNRLMITYRKTRPAKEQIKLIKSAISFYKKAIENLHRNYVKTHKNKAQNTRELAKILGLLETNGLPKAENENINRWQTRLHLLQQRLKAKSEKEKIAATKKRIKAKKKIVKKPMANTKSKSMTG